MSSKELPPEHVACSGMLPFYAELLKAVQVKEALAKASKKELPGRNYTLAGILPSSLLLLHPTKNLRLWLISLLQTLLGHHLSLTFLILRMSLAWTSAGSLLKMRRQSLTAPLLWWLPSMSLRNRREGPLWLNRNSRLP